jgi:hypothetical protein
MLTERLVVDVLAGLFRGPGGKKMDVAGCGGRLLLLLLLLYKR